MMRTRTSVGVVALAITLFVFAGAAPAFAGRDGAGNPGVIPPKANAFGMSYGEWTGGWVQWAMAQPMETNPIEDPDGGFQALDVRTDSGLQDGKVWFLAGSSGSDPVVRDVVVPTGKAIFFPIVNTFWVTFEDLGDLPFSEPGAEEYARASIEFDPADLEVEIDGKILDHDTLLAFRAVSPVFPAWMPEDNWFDQWFLPDYDAPEGIYPDCVADGYWILLAPLSEGQHTIKYKGINASWEFPQEGTYYVTVIDVEEDE